MTYEFNHKLQEGETGENKLDIYFRNKEIVITSVSMELQRIGIDRLWEKSNGTRVSVEYKTDETAGRTNNIFIETVSVDKDNKPGWGYSSIAQYLVYYIPPTNSILFCPMICIKRNIGDWIKKYAIKTIPNKGYNTLGCPVPIDIFKNCCNPIEYVLPGE